MAIPITQGTGQSSVAAETVGGISYQQIEVYGAGGSSVMSIDPSGAVRVSVVGTITVSGMQGASVSGTVGASIIGLVPVQIPSSVAVAIISGSIAASFTPPANQSVSGTVGASVIGTVPVVQSGLSITSVSGSLNVLPYITSLVSGVTSVVSTTSITAVLASAPSAQRNYITQIIATNAAATGAFVDVRDGTTVIYSGFAAASGGGFSASFPTPLRQSSIAAVVDIQTSAQASVKVAISGFTAA